MVRILQDRKLDTVEMRKAYCNALIAAGEKDERIVAVDCDLSSSMGSRDFYKRFPDRGYDLGIMEQNACGVSAGLSAAGLIPFFHTFAIFASRRVYDQLFLSCAYAGLNVKIIGGDAGVSATYNGGTHMAFEDVGILRCVPHITIVEPSDAVMMASLVPQLAESYGVCYMRTPRKPAVRIYEDGSEFPIGKAALLRDGTDITIIASGMAVCEALDAADMLERDGISVRIADMYTIKPIDREFIVQSAKKTGAILTVENHNVIGGLYSAVSEVLARECPTPADRIGVDEQFGEVGQQDYLKERFGLTAQNIAVHARELLMKKEK